MLHTRTVENGPSSLYFGDPEKREVELGHQSAGSMISRKNRSNVVPDGTRPTEVEETMSKKPMSKNGWKKPEEEEEEKKNNKTSTILL